MGALLCLLLVATCPELASFDVNHELASAMEKSVPFTGKSWARTLKSSLMGNLVSFGGYRLETTNLYLLRINAVHFKSMPGAQCVWLGMLGDWHFIGAFDRL